jgi:hypothetical protein
MEQTVEGEDTDVDTVDQISQTFKKKRTMKEKEESKDQDKDKWIRKLGKHVVTIGKYEPVMEEVDLNMELEPERHEEEEVIQLKPAIAPKIVRTGKKLVLPKK